MELKYPRIDIGCGIKKQEGYVGIDIGDFKDNYLEDEFIQADVFGFIGEVEDGTIEKIYANQFIEHIPKDMFIWFMNQVYRILKDKGECEFIFPPAIRQDGMPNGQFYADPLHINPILPGTFYCFSKAYRDGVAEDYRGYGIEADLRIIEKEYLDISQVRVKLVKFE